MTQIALLLTLFVDLNRDSVRSVERSSDIRAVPVPTPKNAYREYLECTGNTCQTAAVTLINQAKQMVLLQGEPEPEVLKAVLAWRGAGPDRTAAVVLDAKEVAKKSSLCSLMFASGFDVFIDKTHRKFAKKIIIIDGFVVIAGRFNSSIEILHNETIADVYFNEWGKHVKHSIRR